MKTVQNDVPALEDIKPVIDEKIVDTVHEIFESVIKVDALNDLFDDLANKLADDLMANSLLEFNLELSDDQKDLLASIVSIKGKEVVKDYLENMVTDERTKIAYGHVMKKTSEIVDSVLSSIGQEINRGAVINARAVVANSKNKDYDEILLRKSKSSGDITVPTSVIVISTNCLEVIKASCLEEQSPEKTGRKKTNDRRI